MLRLTCVFALFYVMSCGHRLPQDISKNRPEAGEAPLDLALINFSDLMTGNQVNLKQYMEERHLEHLLLTFGSKNCATCMEKARYLQRSLTSDNYKLLGEQQSSFELIGVNTDPKHSWPQVLSLVQTAKLDHIRWADPERNHMLRFFQPQGMPYSVPLTVLLTRQGIKWRVASNDHLSPEAMLSKVVQSVTGDSKGKIPTLPKPPSPPALIGDLYRAHPDRLKHVTGERCSDGSAATAHDIDGASKIKFVYWNSSSCDESCQKNLSVLEDTSALCASYGVSCAAVKLTSDACDTAFDMRVDQTVQKAFSHVFNWKYEASGDPASLPEVKGPITLAFDQDGQLVFAHEGQLTSELLASRLASDGLQSIERGPDFKLHDENSEFGFADWRQQKEFSLVTLFATYCTGCIHEMQMWHKKNNVSDVCKELSCQMMAVEFEGPADDDWQGYVRSLRQGIPDGKGGWDFEGFERLNIASPVVVQRSSRMFQDWLVPMHYQEMYEDPRTVLFDREGRIRAVFLSSEDIDQKIMSTLKKLSN
jgi:hypothetical protein